MKSMMFFGVTAIATALPRFACVPQQTEVSLFNNTPYPIQARAYYDNDQNILEDLIDDNGSTLDFMIPAGETQRFVRSCDDLQAVKVTGDLQVIGAIGPSESSGVYRDGSDFGCGDRIRFTYTATNPPTDLSIAFSK